MFEMAVTRVIEEQICWERFLIRFKPLNYDYKQPLNSDIWMYVHVTISNDNTCSADTYG